MTHTFLTVVAALIKKGDEILFCQRQENDAFGLLWEFPGGKVERGESFEDAIRREIKEEIGIEVVPQSLVSIFKDSDQELTITVHLFACTIVKGKPRPVDCRALRYVRLDEINTMDLAPVDKKIAAYLRS